MGSLIQGLTGGISGNTGGAGINYQAGSANLLTPTTTDQANTAYQGNQNALQSQQALLQALQGQNGLGNQSSVYNQLQGVANGTGPNPAQAMLANTTGQNVANQAALMAGQRGTSQNAGLLARQAALQGGNLQQQAAGQGAAMQANQSLTALGQMGNLANTQASNQINATNQNTAAQQGEQNSLLNSIAAQNQAQTSNMASQNSANSNISNTVAGQQGNLIGNIVGGIGSAFQAKAEGGRVMLADGGYLGDTPQFSESPNIPTLMPISSTVAPTAPASSGPKTAAAKYHNPNLVGNMNTPDAQMSGISQGGQAIGQGIGNGLQAGYSGLKSLFGSSGTSTVAGGPDTADLKGATSLMAAEGGKVPVLLSPGEKKLSPKAVKQVEKGASPMALGKTVPGKPHVGGAKNDYANDTHKDEVEEGTIILPRSVTQSKNPHWAAHKFVAQLMAQEGKSLPKKAKK